MYIYFGELDFYEILLLIICCLQEGDHYRYSQIKLPYMFSIFQVMVYIVWGWSISISSLISFCLIAHVLLHDSELDIIFIWPDHQLHVSGSWIEVQWNGRYQFHVTHAAWWLAAHVIKSTDIQSSSSVFKDPKLLNWNSKWSDLIPQPSLGIYIARAWNIHDIYCSIPPPLADQAALHAKSTTKSARNKCMEDEY
jgi:hypothetical protein